MKMKYSFDNLDARSPSLFSGAYGSVDGNDDEHCRNSGQIMSIDQWCSPKIDTEKNPLQLYCTMCDELM